MLGFQKPFGQKSPVGPRGGLGPWAAASQTCLPTCRFCVAILHLRDRFGWHAARLPVLLQRIDELGLSRKKQLEQSASLLNRGLALVGLLDGRAMLLGFVAQCQQVPARGRRTRLGRRRPELAWHPAARHPGHSRHAPKLRMRRKWSGNQDRREDKGTANPHGAPPLSLSDSLLNPRHL